MILRDNAAAKQSPFYEKIIEALKTCYDPEIPVDIYELGLIYSVDIDDNNNVNIEMTLTSPGCPVAATLPIVVQEAVQAIANIGQVQVQIVWEPPWDMDKMSEVARLTLNLD